MGTTLKDIADHLNLSVSTVSRGLNGKGRMSKEVREKYEIQRKTELPTQ